MKMLLPGCPLPKSIMVCQTSELSGINQKHRVKDCCSVNCGRARYCMSGLALLSLCPPGWVKLAA